jgi:hypothetical protein
VIVPPSEKGCVFDAVAFVTAYPELHDQFLIRVKQGTYTDTPQNFQSWVSSIYHYDGDFQSKYSPCGNINPACRFTDANYWAANSDVAISPVYGNTVPGGAYNHYYSYGFDEKRKVCV